MSLKSLLLQEIKSRGNLTLNEVEKICHDNSFKLSNAERRCRELMANCSISPIKNSKGAIIGYSIAPEPQNCPLSPITEKKGINTQVALFEVKLKPKSPYDY